MVLRKGDAAVNGAKLTGEACIATLGREGDIVTIEATADSEFVLLSGEPINEPVASYGPFVMNTREEIMQAVQDFNPVASVSSELCRCKSQPKDGLAFFSIIELHKTGSVILSGVEGSAVSLLSL